MSNPATLSTLGKEDIGPRQTKQKGTTQAKTNTNTDPIKTQDVYLNNLFSDSIAVTSIFNVEKHNTSAK